MALVNKSKGINWKIVLAQWWNARLMNKCLFEWFVSGKNFSFQLSQLQQ